MRPAPAARHRNANTNAVVSVISRVIARVRVWTQDDLTETGEWTSDPAFRSIQIWQLGYTGLMEMCQLLTLERHLSIHKPQSMPSNMP
jgi:hypothetical protein